MPTIPSWVLDAALIVGLFVGFAGAALLAVIEVSLLRVRPSRLRVEAGQGDRRAHRLLALISDLPLVLNSVLFAVLFCQVTVAAISGYLAQRWFGGIWISLTSIIVSLLLFVYAESLPKTFAVATPHELAKRAARFVAILTRICRPVVSALVGFTALHTRKSVSANDVVSECELRLLARQAAQAGTIGIADAELVDRSFHFGDQLVADIMVDRDQIIALPVDLAVGDALEIALDSGHRRLPVYGRDLDEVIGVVRLRDLAAAMGSTDARVCDQMRDPLFAAPDESIAALLERMRASGQWLSVVRHRDATIAGLVTVEDIVAELMGEIEESPPGPEPSGSA